jgi:hypothetical protein
MDLVVTYDATLRSAQLGAFYPRRRGVLVGWSATLPLHARTASDRVGYGLAVIRPESENLGLVVPLERSVRNRRFLVLDPCSRNKPCGFLFAQTTPEFICEQPYSIMDTCDLITTPLTGETV